jgi:predicted transposase/invertase (TIGR01784 family)
MNNNGKRCRNNNMTVPACEENAGETPLNVMEDVVVKAMLTSDTDVSREALRRLLCACTRREVSAVRVTNNDLVPPHKEAKGPRLDVHVTFNDGESANLEIQINKTDDDLKARAELYAAMLLSAQSRRGKKYQDIKRVYQIFFLNRVIFPDSGKLPQRFSYREETEHHRLGDISEIIFYELPKLERRVREITAGEAAINTDCLSEEEKWCIFMRYRHEKRAARLVEKLYREEEGIMLAEKAVEGISRDYLKFAREMAEAKNRMERQYRIYKAEKEGLERGIAQGLERGMAQGLEKGLEQGLEQGKLEIARKMKDMGFPIAQITKVTGLSQKTVKALTASESPVTQ